ncbi:MAG: electron transfer flavoprotein subunit alpha/FixB family protein [Candidatus Marinimicrobia bacterium]|jgi:electron transfer flavoprotein alpha subunit|nr:electron transfer flavoprotein subunit alpha/FixB family protein [Candidatus Neomarinimicrobiota bacterium]MDP7121060.1 electron transfer flavoprotein subunit alpha/FixB family protein [Candidatus Neomarinimicrobiota bacterium]MDP7483234.1 electron transfer flavoprotein subunit alpha/FixB family protein [Candidatus Neomarinimicrobiota bacterium]MDP7528647.1 electron transfer flavoprotein subunit alpha/FixB family protein [Candidatus Neomarinimicrobiota bacterium]MDP7716177.1 electron transfe|tara:strand:+ start:1214 stop:2158 length:945 start_codon:yes stop_codon:yes gene_type:complete
MGDILVITEHLKGEFADITFEMLGKARELTDSSGGQCIAVTFGSMSGKAGQLGAADSVISVGGSDDYNPESYAASVQSVVSAQSPSLVLVGSTSMGMDVANPVATTLGIPVISYCSNMSASGGGFSCTSSMYGGKMNVVTNVDNAAVVMILAGFFSADAGKVQGSPVVENFSAESGAGKVRFKQLIEPEAADVDITQSETLVAVGRGIGGKDDIEVAEELAEILKADLACSRPLVDAGWMSKAQQVGKSGMKVKPKVYIALGISGAPEHIEGMKNSSTIIAINTDKNAPIFDVAHYGMTEDLFDVVEELVEELE